MANPYVQLPNQNRLNGIDPLAYMGTRATTPAQAIIEKRDPTVNDYIGFNLTTHWLNKTTGTVWELIDKTVVGTSKEAIWAQLYPVTIPSLGLTWTTALDDVIPMDVNYGYIINKPVTACSLALPIVATVGSVIKVMGYGATGWIITQGAGQQIMLGSTTTTLGAAGTITSNLPSDSLTLICIVADTIFAVDSCVGNVTLA